MDDAEVQREPKRQAIATDDVLAHAIGDVRRQTAPRLQKGDGFRREAPGLHKACEAFAK